MSGEERRTKHNLNELHNHNDDGDDDDAIMLGRDKNLAFAKVLVLSDPSRVLSSSRVH